MEAFEGQRDMATNVMKATYFKSEAISFVTTKRDLKIYALDYVCK